MTEPIPPELEPFVAEKVVLLQTRKRDGSWVDTPVNIAVRGDRAYFRTPGRASKNKRLKNFPEVRISPCTWRGRVTGSAVEATARLLSGAESRDRPQVSGAAALPGACRPQGHAHAHTALRADRAAPAPVVPAHGSIHDSTGVDWRYTSTHNSASIPTL